MPHVFCPENMRQEESGLSMRVTRVPRSIGACGVLNEGLQHPIVGPGVVAILPFLGFQDIVSVHFDLR